MGKGFMKKLFSFLLFSLFSTLVIAQEAANAPSTAEGKNYTKKYFISTNSGVGATPIGFRGGFLDKRGGYIAARFGPGTTYSYNGGTKTNDKWREKDGTLFSATVGFIFPVFYRNTNFNTHAFLGFGYGQWFNRPPTNGTKMGAELEGGFMFSYSKLMVTLGGVFLVGDGGTPRTDLTVGLGYRIY
jgi:hypothetical protein